MSEKIGVLFVCHGNICRSPAAEAAFRSAVKERNLLERFLIDSAGTAGYHIGELAHRSTRRVAETYGLKIEHRARQFIVEDFSRFQYILAMDRFNMVELERQTRNEDDRGRLMMYRRFDPRSQGGEARDVPDPYYGELSGFEGVQEIMIRTSPVIIDWIMGQHPG